MQHAIVADISHVFYLVSSEPESLREKNLVHLTKFLDLPTKYKREKISFEKNGEDSSEYAKLEAALQSAIPNIPLQVTPHPTQPDLLVSIITKPGILEITVPRKRLYNPSTYIFVLWMIGSNILLLCIAVIFLRNQMRSITKLAQAADIFGKGEDDGSYKPSGAREIRTAGEAFLRMKMRIQNQIEHRTTMLAGISHDLKTPLTRMRLQLAMMPNDDPANGELLSDIAEMEHMVQSYLEFARNENRKENGIRVNLPLAECLRSVISNYRQQSNAIESHIQPGLQVRVQDVLFKRAITNLLDNALRVASKISISANRIDEHHLQIIIDDNGPGIPEKNRLDVFKPFFRLDQARRSENGNVGLGLTIAKDIISTHGGNIDLKTAPEPLGGLRVVITLPT
jgi:two-component system osmolarity sensor histidine kinase EnvZ